MTSSTPPPSRGIIAFGFIGTVAKKQPNSHDSKGNELFCATTGASDLLYDLRDAGYRPVILCEQPELSEFKPAFRELEATEDERYFGDASKIEIIAKLNTTDSVLVFVGSTAYEVADIQAAGTPTVLLNWEVPYSDQALANSRGYFSNEAKKAGARVAIGYGELRDELVSLGINVCATLPKVEGAGREIEIPDVFAL